MEFLTAKFSIVLSLYISIIASVNQYASCTSNSSKIILFEEPGSISADSTGIPPEQRSCAFTNTSENTNSSIHQTRFARRTFTKRSSRKLSPEYRKCDLISVDPDEFTMLINASVHVPKMDKVYNDTDYMIDDYGFLYICQTNTSLQATVNLTRFSDEFIDCEHTPVELGCYIVLENGSVYVPTYEKLFNDSDYIIHDNGQLFVCPGFFEDLKFSPALAIVSILGVAISSLCIILHILMFITLEKMRNLPGYTLLSLCITLLMAYVACAAAYIMSVTSDESDCSSVGMLMFYFFLSSFFWMNVMSYDVWRSLRLATVQLRVTRDRPILIRLGIYSAYSWGVPLLIVILSLIIDHTTSDPLLKLDFDPNNCWFQRKRALLFYFAVPMLFLLCLNVLLFWSSFYMIRSATMNTDEKKTDLKRQLQVAVRLAVVMGLTWLFGVAATTSRSDALWYFFVIFSTLQGVFIFLSFTFTGKARREYKVAFTKGGRKSDANVNSISSRCTTA